MRDFSQVDPACEVLILSRYPSYIPLSEQADQVSKRDDSFDPYASMDLSNSLIAASAKLRREQSASVLAKS